MIGPLNTAASGLMAMQSAVQGHAGRIAAAGAVPGELNTAALTESMVGMKESSLLYKANANLVKVADDMLGTLIDIKA